MRHRADEICTCSTSKAGGSAGPSRPMRAPGLGQIALQGRNQGAKPVLGGIACPCNRKAHCLRGRFVCNSIISHTAFKNGDEPFYESPTDVLTIPDDARPLTSLCHLYNINSKQSSPSRLDSLPADTVPTKLSSTV